MFENGIRGGESGVFGDRYIKSDNNHKILYVDQNNLFGYAMSQHLTTGNFQIFESKITESFIDKFFNTHDCSSFDYVLIVDLIYLDNIKEKGKIFPYCPDNKTINLKILKEYMKEHVLNPYKPTSNLICDQANKEYYIVHYRNPKFYVRMSIIFCRVHRIVSFDQ